MREDFAAGLADLTATDTPRLLQLFAGLLQELRDRQVLRSFNNPAGDYAEYLFAKAFGWQLEGNSNSGHDAVDAQGIRYQIKCRRITARNPSRQLSGLRNLAARPFDRLAVVLLGAQFEVTRAALIPIDIVIAHASFRQHVNAHRFIMRDEVWDIDGVHDVTRELRAVEQEAKSSFQPRAPC